MMPRVIPAGEFTVYSEDMSLDLVCFEYALRWLKDRKTAGTLKGYLEATYEANPGLAAHGLLLPCGIKVKMPELIISNENKIERLWS